MNLRRVLLVAVGGMIGTAARLGVGLLVPDIAGVPVATIAVNVVGALLIGVLAARVAGASELRLFLGTGVLGGFTTYSAFAVGSVGLWTDAPLLAAGYACASLALGVVAAWAGLRLATPQRRTPRKRARA